MFADVVGLHDVLMPQPGGDLDFAAEPADQLRVGQLGGVNQLEGDDAVHPHLLRLVDRPHPPLAEQIEQHIPAAIERELRPPLQPLPRLPRCDALPADERLQQCGLAHGPAELRLGSAEVADGDELTLLQT